MPASRNSWRWWFAWIVIAATSYATIRYHLAQHEPWSRFYFWTVNKALSYAAVILLASSYLSARKDRQLARALGLCGFSLALVHSILSWPLLSAFNYPKLYSNGALGPAGWGCLLSGIAAMALLFGPALTSFPRFTHSLKPPQWALYQRLGYFALALVAFHVAVYGFGGWFTPSKWPALMPPITLISFLLAAVPTILRLLSNKDQENA
ncbi:MAG: hypothetical protein HY821_14180 [Acidobacteria bacterium]|nr:hypothetical protein [Acidobacteriota bacterium]